MDEMKVQSKLLRGIISKIISKNVKKKIGSDCDIAPRVFIGDGTHVIDKNSPNVAGAGKMLPVKIGNGCWLCANSTILPGAEIGEKCIIAAGSVFKGKSNPLEVWGGVIARKVKNL